MVLHWSYFGAILFLKISYFHFFVNYSCIFLSIYKINNRSLAKVIIENLSGLPVQRLS